jgi:hypothetical protein
MKDLKYYKDNATENYMTTPISVLRYITELEKNNEAKQLILSGVSQQRELLEGFVDWFNANDKTQAILSERIEEYLKTL